MIYKTTDDNKWCLKSIEPVPFRKFRWSHVKTCLTESARKVITFTKHLISQKYYLIEIYLRQFPSESVSISRRNLVKPSPGTSATMSRRPSAARKKSFNFSCPALNFFNCCLYPSLINVGKEQIKWLKWPGTSGVLRAGYHTKVSFSPCPGLSPGSQRGQTVSQTSCYFLTLSLSVGLQGCTERSLYCSSYWRV